MPDHPLLVRPARATDAADVARLEEECLGDDAWSEGLVRMGVEGDLPTVGYLVAVRGDEVVGHAVTSVAGDIAELQRIAVTTRLRRGGVASALLAGVLEAVAPTEADRLLIEVRTDNGPARSFYARHGFAEIHRRQRYYADGAVAIVMRRELPRRPDAPDPRCL